MEKEIWFEATGTYAVLMENPAAMKAPSSGTTTRKRIPTPEEEAESLAYRMASGQLHAKSEMFRSAVIDAVIGRKVGKLAAKGVFQGNLFDEQEMCPLFHPATRAPLMEYEIDTRRVVVQGNGVMRSRPKLREWACQFRFLYDDEALTPEMILEAAVRAGKVIGIMGFRPKPPPGIKSGKGGPYGRFSVVMIRGGERVAAA